VQPSVYMAEKKRFELTIPFAPFRQCASEIARCQQIIYLVVAYTAVCSICACGGGLSEFALSAG
jgi:hypothetical protein